jgi:hypothetical protein
VNEHLNEKGGQTYQSAPVAAFYTRDFALLHRYIEYPAIYHKERLVVATQVARPGETKEEAWDRFLRDWSALQQGPLWLMWASAAATRSCPRSTNDSWWISAPPEPRREAGGWRRAQAGAPLRSSRRVRGRRPTPCDPAATAPVRSGLIAFGPASSPCRRRQSRDPARRTTPR